ncbi:MAG: SurA N-terminal domain-containing protein [Desulfuromonadaceae bacterium]
MIYYIKFNELLSSLLTLQSLFYRLLLLTLLPVRILAIDAWAGEPAINVTRAATVNGVAISVQDFQRELDRIQRQKGISVEKSDEVTQATAKREALENLISREILYQESVMQEITIEPPVVEREVDQAKAKFANSEQYAENLRRINMTETMVREQVTRGLAMRELINRSVGKNNAATDEELKKYYQQHQDAFTAPFDDVREKVRSLLLQENNITMLQRYVKSLRDAATVVILLSGE